MNFRIRLTSDQISKQTEKGYIDQDAGLFLSFDPLTVPNIDKEISDMLLGAEIIDKNGNISQEYIDINNAKFVTNDQGTMRYAVEATNVAGAMATTQNARNAMIGSYLQDPQKAQIIYQQIFGNNEKLEIGGGSESSMFTPESERKFVAAFDQYFEALIPQTKIGKAQAITRQPPGGKTTIDVSFIDDLNIPPAAEVNGEKNLYELEKVLRNQGFVVKKNIDVGDETVIDVTSSIKGADNTVQIDSSMSSNEIKALLKQILTGKQPGRQERKKTREELIALYLN
jgi:hypothetical protein